MMFGLSALADKVCVLEQIRHISEEQRSIPNVLVMCFMFPDYVIRVTFCETSRFAEERERTR